MSTPIVVINLDRYSNNMYCMVCIPNVHLIFTSLGQYCQNRKANNYHYMRTLWNGAPFDYNLFYDSSLIIFPIDI